MILGCLSDPNRSDQTRTLTRDNLIHSRAHAQRPLNIAPRRWHLKTNHGDLVYGSTITKTEQSNKKTEDTLEISIASSPLLFRTWRLRALCAHPRHPKVAEAGSGAHTTMQTFALVYARCCWSAGVLCDAVRYFRLFRILSFYSYYAVSR